MDLLVVGSGFFGATVAQTAAENGLKVCVLEKREHIGGNAYTFFDPETGIDIHKYGTHIFHTSNLRVWNYINKFTKFNDYQHHVVTIHNKKPYSMPINLGTINQLFNSNFNPDQAKSFIESRAALHSKSAPRNFEEKAISLMGTDLYEAFIQGYTHKQWQTDPRNLPSSIIERLPIRFNYNSRYFNDTWEGIPSHGYTKVIEAMLDHPLINVIVNADFLDPTSDFSKHKYARQVPIVYTGPLDRYFDYVRGELTWRTLSFEMESFEIQDYQGTSVMNYADLDVPFTRTHEFKHLHPEKSEIFKGKATIVMREYSRFASRSDEVYYPVNSQSDRTALLKYRQLIKEEKDVFFGGRLATYKYLDMHMAIASAFALWDGEISNFFTRRFY